MIEELIRNSMNHYIESFEEIQKEYGEMLVREYMDIQKSKVIEYYNIQFDSYVKRKFR